MVHIYYCNPFYYKFIQSYYVIYNVCYTFFLIYILAGIPAIHAGYGMFRAIKPLTLSHGLHTIMPSELS